MRRILSLHVVIVVMLLSCGCASVPTPAATYQPGVVLNTLSANTSFSISRGEQGMGASGYLEYQSPDRLRLMVLSPFGGTLAELFVNGQRATVIMRMSGQAFSGLLSELPQRGDSEIWSLAGWVIEFESPDASNGTVVRARDGYGGIKELVIYEQGLVVSKQRDNGDMVRYSKYGAVNGVMLPSEIIVDSHDGGRLRIVLEEPEVNGKLSPGSFEPKLEGLKVYPLAALKGLI
jgi:hypothetical protein